jgi:coiled-coil domain-containing protein 77
MSGLDLEFLAEHAAPSAELLSFYRGKVAGFEAERRELLARLGDAEAQGAELHRLRWEARAREEEIGELQRALSDARLFLYDERELALKLAAENDGLKAQEVEDRRRIAHLLALTEPITHEVRRSARARARARPPAAGQGR